MRKYLSQHLKFFLGWPLSLAAIFFIIKIFAPNFESVSEKITTIQIFPLLIAIFLFLAFFFLRNFVWYKILRYLGHQFSFTETSYLWSISQLKRYIPGNIWALVGLSVAFSEKNMQKKDIAYAILIETQIVILATLLFSLTSLPFVFKTIFPLDNSYLLQILFVVFSALAALVYVFFPQVIKKIHVKPIHLLSYFMPKFAPRQTFTLLLFMLFGYLCFGLGYYLTAVSLTFLSPSLIWQLSGYFVLSLLIGFLSIITPTGLGVREGVITFGLSKIMPLTLAAFASIFTRIVLVFSELLYLLFFWLVQKMKTQHIKKVENFLSKKIYEIILSIGIILFFIYFSVISILRYNNFYTGRFDLGNMTQTVWNTTQGRIFEMTDPNSTTIVSRLAFHADFILILLSPFYFLWSDPRMLLIIQALIVALGAIFVYLLTKDVIKNKLFALLLGLAYILNPSVQWVVLYEFHAVALATTLLLAAFYFLYKKRYGLFILFALVAALTKEQIWFIVALFGFYIIATKAFILFKEKKMQIVFKDKTVLFGLGIALASLSVFYFLIWHVIPEAAGGNHFALSYYTENGDSPTGFLKSVILSPVKTLSVLIQPDRLEYMLQLLLPLGFLPLLAPLYLIFAFPDFLLNILSDKVEPHQIYYQYTAAITPFLFIATIFTSAFLLQKLERKAFPTLIAVIALATVLGIYFYSPLPGMRRENIAVFTRPQENRDVINKALRDIPTDAKVATTNNLGAHLSHRQNLYVLPYGKDNADYITFLFKEGSWENTKELLNLAESLKRDKRFLLLVNDGGFLLFKRVSK